VHAPFRWLLGGREGVWRLVTGARTVAGMAGGGRSLRLLDDEK
jgi:hypothetical protein